MRFVENKQEEGELMRSSIDNGPYIRKDFTDLNNNTIHEPISKMSKSDKDQYFVDIKVMNYILQEKPNDIYNYVDACSDAKQKWNRIKRLMQGSKISQHERHSRLMDEFDKFVVVEGESLTYVYERFSTLINVMDRNKVLPPKIAINTKFLNSLQPEWSKYVTMTRQKYVLKTEEYDALIDHLSQFEPHFFILSITTTIFRHPSSVIDDDDDYQWEIQGDAQEGKLTTAMMLLARVITQRYSTSNNNRLRSSSNTKNQVVIQDGRVDIQSKNIGYARNENKNARRQNRNQVTNAGNGLVQSIEEYDQNVQRHPRIEEQMLLALRDEAGVHLDDEENYFMLDNAYRNNTLDEHNEDSMRGSRKCYKSRVQLLDSWIDLKTGPDVIRFLLV
uniref:Gag-Pol polyprotein n=1 Tax=Tanacetum cinerariifolium TaxID=118510 RepID=A0A699HIQ1_TANCI|nr:hypothetical protein [Tanacetum cinerariifolium]